MGLKKISYMSGLANKTHRTVHLEHGTCKNPTHKKPTHTHELMARAGACMHLHIGAHVEAFRPKCRTKQVKDIAAHF